MPRRFALTQVISQSFCAGRHTAPAPSAFTKLGLRPGDAHRHDLVVAPPQVARARPPGDALDHQLDGLEAAAVLFVVQVAHANQSVAVALDEFLGAALPGRRVRRVSTSR
jgi:hypothetical protein